MGNQNRTAALAPAAEHPDTSLMTDESTDTNITIFNHAENDDNDMSSKEIYLTLSRPVAANPFFVRPDLTKLVIVRDAGMTNHKPVYLIYDIKTGIQIEKRVEVDHPGPLKGRYCYGYFDKTNYEIFIFCIGLWAKKIFYVNTITGQYTEQLVNPEGEYENPYINEVMYMDYLSFNEKVNVNGYSVRMSADARRNIYNVHVSLQRWQVYVCTMKYPIASKSYFMRKRVQGTYLTLIYGYFRSGEDMNDDRILPQDLAKCINDYINYIDSDTEDMCLITESTAELKIVKLDYHVI